MDTEQQYIKASRLEERGDSSEAIKLYSNLIKTSKDPRYFIAFGICLQKLGHWKESASKLEKGIALKPSYCEPDARLFLAKSYLKLNEKKKAIKQWEIVNSMEPEYPSYDLVQKEASKMLSQYK